VRQSLAIVAMLIVAWLAWMLRDLVMLIGFAALVAYALDPVVSLVERAPLPGRRALPRGVAAGLVILALVVAVAWGLAGAVPRLVHEIPRFVEAAPGALARAEEEVRRFAASQGWGAALGTGEEAPSSVASSLLHAAQQWSLSLLRGFFGNLGQLAGLVLLPVLAFYLLADREAVRSSAMAFVPRDLRPHTERLLNAVDPALRACVRGQSLVCLVMGTVMAIVLQLLGVPVALLLGVMVGLAEIIPFLGFWIAAIAIALAGYSVSPALALTGLVAYVVANNLVGYFVTPRLLGRATRMHPFVVTVSILGGGALLGPAGGILALPAAAVAQAVITEFAPPRKPAPPRP
jgi:predicted PurR-regulated permease PerM